MLEWFESAFTAHFGEPLSGCTQVSGHGSDRPIFRLTSRNSRAIGILSPKEPAENAAFQYLTNLFLKLGLRVPKILDFEEKDGAFLVEYLGDKTLLELMLEERENTQGSPSSRIVAYYRLALQELPRFQVLGGEYVDFNQCYPKTAFDCDSMLWDMNYYRREYLDRLSISYSSEALTTDFEKLASFLNEAPSTYFMYRDFQARNIVVCEDHLGFIDFQGGRRGPLQYDLVSLLYQSRAALPQELRNELFEFYLSEAKKHIELDATEFRVFFEGFLLIRLLQVLGAYGNLGLGKGKRYFIESIPYALTNLAELLKRNSIPVSLPELRKTFDAILSPDNQGLIVGEG